MSEQNHSRRFKVCFITFLVLLVGGALSIVIHGQSEQPKLPTGRWTFSAGPYLGPGWNASPVQVYSVTTDADKGLMVSKVTLVNRTTKDISAVRLHWSLTEAQEPDHILLQGDTDLIGVWLVAGHGRVLSYPVVSFAKTHKPLLKGGKLIGDYRLEIAVSEVKYADESSWLKGQAVYNKAAYSVDDAGCANQGCFYNDADDVKSFQCSMNHKGFICSVTNNGKSCTETVCDSGVPPPLDQ
jgi:hypothetical protein